MNDTQMRLLARMHDIQGLDSISWWPPAPGWWLLLAALLGIGGLLWLLLTHRRRPFGSWQRDAGRQLRQLQSRLLRQPSKDSASQLSELLRRIAIARYGRDACAGLSGQDWLDWLRANDPVGFPWDREGRLLLSLPYQPAEAAQQTDRASLGRLIRAAMNWTRGD
jgi:hypothetical protein